MRTKNTVVETDLLVLTLNFSDHIFLPGSPMRRVFFRVVPRPVELLRRKKKDWQGKEQAFNLYYQLTRRPDLKIDELFFYEKQVLIMSSHISLKEKILPEVVKITEKVYNVTPEASAQVYEAPRNFDI